MSPSVQLTSEQLKEMMEDEKKSYQGARKVQEQVDGKEVLNPDISRSELGTDLNSIHNEFDHDCPDKEVRLLRAYRIRQSTDDCVPGHRYSISGLPGIKFQMHDTWAIWFIAMRWVWDADMPGIRMTNKSSLEKTFTSFPVTKLCKLVTE